MWSAFVAWLWPVSGRSYKGFTATPNGNPLPSQIHASLQRENLNVHGRVIIIGDIHGCDNEFGDLLDKIGFKEKEDNLVLVGDLVNKGPASADVIRRARSLKAYAVRGNHDDSAMKSYQAWKQQGLAPKEKHEWVKCISEADAAWMNDLPFSLAIPAYRSLVVHAGLVPGKRLDEQDMADMYKMRDLVPNDGYNTNTMLQCGGCRAAEKPNKMGTAWAPCWSGPEHVFFGHDAKRKLQLEPFASGLDTGCCYGGALTACILPPLEPHLDEKTTTANQTSRVLGAVVEHSGSSQSTSLADIGGMIVKVKSRQMYEKPSG